MDMQKLTVPLLRELIDDITVYESQGVGKNRSQHIMIRYKFIGYVGIHESGSNYKADTRKRCSSRVYYQIRIKQKSRLINLLEVHFYSMKKPKIKQRVFKNGIRYEHLLWCG